MVDASCERFVAGPWTRIAFVLVVGLLSAECGASSGVRIPAPSASDSLELVRSVMLGQSMWPTLKDGQSITVDHRAYRQAGPRRGDIIDFRPPNEETRDFIKRVIAIPGDYLRIVAGVVYVNGSALVEPYLPEPWTYNNRWPPDGDDVLVPPDHYFVLGDNRNHSSDSRTFGFIGLESVMGKVTS